MSSLPPPSVPPPPGRATARPSARTLGLVGGLFLGALAILRVCYRVARRRQACDVVDPVLGAIRDVTCKVGERFHTVLAPWFVVLSVAMALVMLTILLFVPLISRRLDPDQRTVSPSATQNRLR